MFDTSYVDWSALKLASSLVISFCFNFTSMSAFSIVTL